MLFSRSENIPPRLAGQTHERPTEFLPGVPVLILALSPLYFPRTDFSSFTSSRTTDRLCLHRTRHVVVTVFVGSLSDVAVTVIIAAAELVESRATNTGTCIVAPNGAATNSFASVVV